jgi:hypothetical protein
MQIYHQRGDARTPYEKRNVAGFRSVREGKSLRADKMHKARGRELFKEKDDQLVAP